MRAVGPGHERERVMLITLNVRADPTGSSAVIVTARRHHVAGYPVVGEEEGVGLAAQTMDLVRRWLDEFAAGTSTR